MEGFAALCQIMGRHLPGDSHVKQKTMPSQLFKQMIWKLLVIDELLVLLSSLDKWFYYVVYVKGIIYLICTLIYLLIYSSDLYINLLTFHWINNLNIAWYLLRLVFSLNIVLRFIRVNA